MLLPLIFILLSVALPAVALPQPADMAEHPQWHALLHYQKATGESTIDSEKFFLAPDGKTNPLSELNATIQAFHLPDTGKPDTHALCRFPARLAYLKPLLSFQKLPTPACPARDDFLATYRPDTVSLIYAEPSFYAPESLFGHLFLHLDGKQGAHTAAYGALVPSKDSSLRLLKGVGGRYKSILTLTPAEETLQTYGRTEKRTLWSYALNTTKEQNSLLTDHLWESANASSDYFFFSENCAFMIAELLDVIYPDAAVSASIRPSLPVKGVAPVTVIQSFKQRVPTAMNDARMHPASNAPPLANAPRPPDRDAGMTATDIAGGVRNRQSFVAWRFRPSFHELSDPSAGMPAATEISLLSTELRYYTQENRLRLHDFSLFKAQRLTPSQIPFSPPAFFMETGIDSYDYPDKKDMGYTAYAGAGIGFAADILPHASFYALGTFRGRAGGCLPDTAIAGAGMKTGIFTEWDVLRAHVSAERIFYTDKAATTTRLNAEISLSFNRRASLFARYLFEGAQKRNTRDFTAGIRFYF